MGNTAGECAESFHLLGVLELGFQSLLFRNI